MKMKTMTMPNGALRNLAAPLLLALAVAGCTGSDRFDAFGSARSAVAPAPVQTFTPAPTGRVSTTSLPPVASQALPPLVDGAASPGGLPSSGASGLPPIGSTVPIDPEPPLASVDPPRRPQAEPPEPQRQVIAARPDTTPAQPAAPTRTGVTGNWTAKEATGGNCKVTLSSTPTLDLYKASTAGCQTRELQRVSAWELRGEEIYLYEPGGGVSARLKQAGRTFEGSSAKTGAPVTLSK